MAARKATEAPKDARATALAQIANPALATSGRNEVPAGEAKKAFEGVEAKDFGGTVKVGVLFDTYRVHVDGVWQDASKGEVLKVDEKVADRGESINGLVRL